ncbi:TonB family protein [Phenylobacterium sp.]|uniref:TonB family protein n=1 Tax=Phenylobacterium sp. TaxID=1871053 RepID=UPI002E37E63E|nr:TonB family protein [Phenylobacterium sp.]HEX2562161.1 TonB family protein [Phenylobacterium sp.]
MLGKYSKLKTATALAAGLAALWCPPGAVAQDRDPDWVRRPRPEDLLAVWPKVAWEKGIGGKAVISCTVTTAGALRDCSVVEEDPPGMGFGGAAITLTAQLAMRPKLVGGKPVPGMVRIPINFSDPGLPIGSHLRGGAKIPALTKRVVSNVPWRQAPTYEQVIAIFPQKARAAGVDARAAIECTINRDGRLGSCQTISGEPNGMGAGAAARKLAPLFLAPETDAAGKPLAGARVHIPVTFGKSMLASEAPVIGKPSWTALPTGSDLAAGFPVAARSAGVTTGRIRLRCQIATAGRLQNCAVQSEEPAGMGFGDAAKALTSNFQMSLWSAEGLPTQGGFVVIPLRYDLPKDEPAAAGTP